MAEFTISAACENCRFAEWPTGEPNVVECHRRAPQVFFDAAPMWPKVDRDDWCGEWEARRG